MLSDPEYIKPSLVKKFDGIIWKIEIDDKFPIIAIESRNAETHTTAFSAYNFQSGECLFENLVVEDSWRWSLDRVSNKIIFIHSYLSDETPEHNGIIAINDQGNIIWQQYNKALRDISDEGLVVSDPKIQGKWLELLNPTNGTSLKSFIPNYRPVTRDITIPSFIFDKNILPVPLSRAVAGEIAYLNYHNKLIFSYHIENNNTYTQKLLIYEGDKILLEDSLAINILKRNPEAFFISCSHLFCIRDEKREIVSYLV